MLTRVDTDQTVPSRGIWSESTLFSQNCLSKILGSLQYRYLSAKQTITFFTPTESTIQTLADTLLEKPKGMNTIEKRWKDEFFNPFNR